MTISLKNVYTNHTSPTVYKFLYKLLHERQPEESISHKIMPTYEQHCYFVGTMPYRYWAIIETEQNKIMVGSIYLSKQKEIGISIALEHRRKGFATEALKKIKYLWGNEFYANINPANEKSIKLFEKAGFKHIQNTYKLD